MSTQLNLQSLAYSVFADVARATDPVARAIVLSYNHVTLCLFLVMAVLLLGGAVYALWRYYRSVERIARSVARYVARETTDPTEHGFAKYWGARLRAELNYPTSWSAANRAVAANRLDALWREELPDLRQSDRLFYKHRVISFAFIPSNEEVTSAEIARSYAASWRRRAVAVPSDF